MSLGVLQERLQGLWDFFPFFFLFLGGFVCFNIKMLKTRAKRVWFFFFQFSTAPQTRMPFAFKKGGQGLEQPGLVEVSVSTAGARIR